MEFSPSAKDLLGIDVNPEYTDEAQALVKNKIIAVTGAGGSIGSEIVRQLMRLKAKQIICIDRDEYSLYKLQLSTTGSAFLTDENMILADIQNYQSIKNIFAKHEPDIVFHAAAVKQLPLLERSPEIALLTNVMGTENVIRSAIECKVERVVNISTDKAASPSSVLGFTKRLAEMIAKDYSDQGTLISSVRFGNVFASRGSFIETLQWQIANNQTIHMTHPDMTRYFMSIPQASCLVIEAGVLAASGHTYVLDMGEPVKILDVVHKFLTAHKKTDFKIAHLGVRPGEKIKEVLYNDREKHSDTSHPKISTITVTPHHSSIKEAVKQLYNEVQNNLIESSQLITSLKDLTTDMQQKYSSTADTIDTETAAV